MTPLQARRLHVLRENHLELYGGAHRQSVDWVLLLIQIGLGALLVALVAGVVALVATIIRVLENAS